MEMSGKNNAGKGFQLLRVNYTAVILVYQILVIGGQEQTCKWLCIFYVLKMQIQSTKKQISYTYRLCIYLQHT